MMNCNCPCRDLHLPLTPNGHLGEVGDTFAPAAPFGVDPYGNPLTREQVGFTYDCGEQVCVIPGTLGPLVNLTGDTGTADSFTTNPLLYESPIWQSAQAQGMPLPGPVYAKPAELVPTLIAEPLPYSAPTFAPAPSAVPLAPPPTFAPAATLPASAPSAPIAPAWAGSTAPSAAAPVYVEGGEPGSILGEGGSTANAPARSGMGALLALLGGLALLN